MGYHHFSFPTFFIFTFCKNYFSFIHIIHFILSILNKIPIHHQKKSHSFLEKKKKGTFCSLKRKKRKRKKKELFLHLWRSSHLASFNNLHKRRSSQFSILTEIQRRRFENNNITKKEILCAYLPSCFFINPLAKSKQMTTNATPAVDPRIIATVFPIFPPVVSLPILDKTKISLL